MSSLPHPYVEPIQGSRPQKSTRAKRFANIDREIIVVITVVVTFFALLGGDIAYAVNDGMRYAAQRTTYLQQAGFSNVNVGVGDNTAYVNAGKCGIQLQLMTDGTYTYWPTDNKSIAVTTFAALMANPSADLASCR